MSTPVPGTPAGTPPAAPQGDGTALPRALTLLLGVATVLIAVLGLRELAWLFGPVLLALVIVVTVQPLRTVLDRHVPRSLSFVLTLLTIYGVIVGFVVALTLAMARFASLVADYGAAFDEKIHALSQRLQNAGLSGSEGAAIQRSLGSSRLGDAVLSVAQHTLGALSALVLMLAVVFFLVIDAGRFPYRLQEVGSLRPPLASAMHDFARSTRRYLIVSTVFGLAVAALDTAALAILGVPAPLLWGLVAFLTNYIPNIGFVIGLVPPAVLAWLDSGPGEMLAVIVLYCLFNLVLQSGIQPKVVGDTVGLATTLTFLSVVFWTWVLGPVGAILSVPMSLLVRAFLVDADPRSGWLRTLVANEASPDDPGRSANVPRRRRPRTRSRTRTTSPPLASDDQVVEESPAE